MEDAHPAATHLRYMEDTYLMDCTATVVDARGPDGDGCGEETSVVVLDSTVLYPEGGGQPSDQGVLQCTADPNRTFLVSFVKAKAGVVHHYGKGTLFSVGEEVAVTVHEATRMRHAKLHSAGHLLDSCLAVVGREYAGMEAAKGYHGEEAYVEYIGKVPPEAREHLIIRLQEEAARLIKANGAVQVSVDSYQQAAEKCGGKLPAYISEGSTPRTVTMGGLACPCGGTHVSNVGEIGEMKITGIRVKKGITRISYTVASK